MRETRRAKVPTTDAVTRRWIEGQIVGLERYLGELRARLRELEEADARAARPTVDA